ncbi:MAG: DMT family transporter [Pseudomonadota bacterium]|nr:DMT family transporter [Pseudomonadota bacterium]
MNQSPQVIGYIIVVIGALAFAGNNVFAVLSYEAGTTPLTLITGRMVFTLIVLTLIMKFSGLAIPLPKRERNAALGLGILNGTMAFCLMSAFDYVAVGLAVLVFYLYPMLTGIGAWLTGQEKLNTGLIVGLIGGFFGLALSLEITGDSANAIGIALAGCASVLMAATALLSARVLKTDNARSVTLHMHISAAAMFIAVSIIAGDLSLPDTTRGWVGYICVPIFYTVAIASFFAGIAHIGAVRASLVMNLEPVGSIALGFLLLGQILTPRQLLGAAIVIGAVTAIKWLGGKPKPSN